MQKPTTVLRQEFINNQVDAINNSGLPAFVLVDIFEELVVVLRNQAAEQYKKDKAEWDEYQKKRKELSNVFEEEREAIVDHYNETIAEGKKPETE